MWKKAAFFLCIAAGISSLHAADSRSETDPIIESIRFDGNTAIADKDIEAVLPVRIGDPYSPKLERATRQVVGSLYRSQGYINCDVATRADVQGSSVAFIVSVREGPLFVFGQTRIEGLSTLPDKVVLNNLTYKPGDIFKKRELFNTQSALYRSGFFSSVMIQTETGTANTADMKIKVQQQPTRWVKAGLGWGSEERERVSLTLTHNNLGRRAYKFELYGTVSSIWQEYKADFTNPYFFNTQVKERTSLAWRKEIRAGYSFESLTGETAFSRSFGKKWNVTWTPYQIKRVNTYNVDREIAQITPDFTDERSILIATGYDSANDFFFPTKGQRTNVVLQRTGGVLGGNADFNKASLETRHYVKVFDPVVLALAGRIGGIWPFSQGTIPIFDRFFIGGGNSVRGYSERGIGPRDTDNSPLGGNWVFGGNAELRFPLFWRLEGVTFIDGGQVGQQFRQTETRNWRYGAGGGIRFRTPVGPIRLDYGHKINPASDDHDHWRVHFSLGETF